MLKRDDTLLFVSKDMGGANVGIPLVKLAKESDYKTVVVAEGLAADKYEDAGFRLYFKGTVNFSDEPFNLDAKRLIEKLKPATIITTLGVPINLEQDFGLAANHLGIPLVFLEDFWGTYIRSEATPNLVLSIDQAGAELAKGKYGDLARVEIVGNHAVSRALELSVPSETRKTVEDLKEKFGPVLVCTVYGVHGSEYLKLLKECLKQTPDWVLIPRFHPKAVNLQGPSGKTFGEEWRGLLEEFGERLVFLESISADSLAALADATLSDFSTLLTTALACGHSAISVVTTRVREAMKREIGFTSHPLVESGLVKEVAEPCNLAGFMNPPDHSTAAEKLRPYEPKKALRAIEAL